MDGIHCSQFVFYNDFDSANLSKVELVPQNESAVCKQSSNNKLLTIELVDAEFNIWTKPDCYGTEFENGNRTWFYFSIKAPRPGLLVRLNLVDLNRQGKMYSQGMAPVFRVLPGKPKWERIQDKPVYNLVEDIFTLSFKFRTPENADSCTYFAFTYPFSYTDLQKMLVNIDSKYFTIQPTCEDDIYYVHETVCESLEGRNIDLITITSYHGITMEREERLKNLFMDKTVPRPHKFVGKKVIFMSARVHPGETPSSFVFNGFLNMLLNRDDLQAQYLRKLYVFKLIPFLNPDGVARGHYRTDTKGVNLNRIYLNPDFDEHPSIYAARALIRYYHFGAEKEDKIIKCDNCQKQPPIAPAGENDNVNRLSTMSLSEGEDPGGAAPNPPPASTWCTKWHNFCRQCGCKLIPSESKAEIKFENVAGDVNRNESGLFLYLDMHGHASKKGIFMYGNHFDDLERRVECMLLPKLMGLNNHHFHFQACNFTERNMYLRDKRDGMSRAGSGRVAVLSITGIIKSYTLECNYNTGRFVNVLPPTVKESANKVHTLPVPPKYTPQIFEEAGKSLGASILDLTGQNPFSRLPNSEFHNLGGLRDWLRNSCCNNSFGEGKPKMTRIRPSAAGHTAPQTQAKLKVRPQASKAIAKKAVPVERKENQPSCSSSRSSVKLNRPFKAKSRKDLTYKAKNLAEKRPRVVQRPCKKLQEPKPVESASSELHLREICFIKSTEGGKTMIAKYKNKEGEEFDDSLVVSWDAPSSKATVFSHKTRASSAPHYSMVGSSSEPGPSKPQQGVFRVHNFAKTCSKVKLKKQALRRLSSATELGKMERKKKKKLRVK
ncbi:cytosolic carboxypeptidase-like protein 5 isoform X2 [Sitophilus oryzae]|uniref:tubulin-glutamate carboxypeptidase n=1 Tax=Sitophilus oryzae TaxID=7048 RepID=A0A6J2Y6R6_SITOR|nr:cytosolic carboxypeptidase-like protein 5 isoform X2 [Sitophilus oryzae]